MEQDQPGGGLRTRLRRGDEEAWARVAEVVLPEVLTALRRKCGIGASRWETEAAVASACRTLFGRLKNGSRFERLESWDDLEDLLVVISRNKYIDALRKQRCGINAFPRVARSERSSGSNLLEDLLQEEVMATANAVVTEVLDGLGPEERAILQGKLDGLREVEIAERLKDMTGKNRTRYMVREAWRVIRSRIKHSGEHYFGPGGDTPEVE